MCILISSRLIIIRSTDMDINKYWMLIYAGIGKKRQKPKWKTIARHKHCMNGETKAKRTKLPTIARGHLNKQKQKLYKLWLSVFKYVSFSYYIRTKLVTTVKKKLFVFLARFIGYYCYAVIYLVHPGVRTNRFPS